MRLEQILRDKTIAGSSVGQCKNVISFYPLCGLRTLSSSEELRFGTNPLSIMWEKLSRKCSRQYSNL